MKIAFFEIKDEEQTFFKSHLNSNHELFFFKETIQEVLKKTETYDIVSLFVNSRITDTVLEKLPNLSYLQTRSTGFEHLNCNMLYKREVKVSNVVGYAGPAVAEFAFSLLLNSTRKTHISIERSKKGNAQYSDLKGIEIYGKTIGILGLGTIGLQMAKIALGLGMNVLCYSRTYKPAIDELGISFVTLDTLLKDADIIMPALPLTSKTKYLINHNNVTLVKKESIIINVARCEIIENKLYYELPNIIASDVCSDINLAKKESFLYTPHMAYYTQEALVRILAISLENMEQFIAGEIPINCLKIPCKKEYSD